MARAAILGDLAGLAAPVLFDLTSGLGGGGPVTSVYVSPSGSDGGDGSFGSPWLTLAHAQTQVRAMIMAGLVAPLTVYLRGGAYRLSSGLTFGPLDSGTRACPVTWKAYTGETPLISGGQVISTWTLHDVGLNIWQADVPSGSTFRQLYADDSRVARGFINASMAGASTADSAGHRYTGTSGQYDAVTIPTDIEFVYPLHWYEHRLRVTAVTSTTVTMNAASFANFVAIGLVGHSLFPSYAEGTYEILAQNHVQNSWCLVSSLNKVYYIPPTGVSDPNAQEVIAPTTLATLVTVADAAWLTFDGLTLAHTHWAALDPTYDYVEIQANITDPNGDTPPAALELRHSTRVNVLRCTVKHTGGAGIWLHDGVSRCVVDHNIVTDTSSNGIQSSSPAEGAATDRITALCDITNNLVTFVGQEFHGACAIIQWYAYGNHINQNTIHDCPYTGISNGWGWGTGGAAIQAYGHNQIHNNLIHHIMLVMDDGGAIYDNSMQLGTTINGNVAHDIHPPTVGGAYYVDEGTRGVEVQYNVAYNVTPYILIHHNTYGDTHLQNTYADSTSRLASPGVLDGTLGATPTVMDAPFNMGLSICTQLGVAFGAGVDGVGRPVQSAFLTDGATGYWPLDETSGTTAVERFQGLNGTYTSPDFSLPGVPGEPGATAPKAAFLSMGNIQTTLWATSGGFATFEFMIKGDTALAYAFFAVDAIIMGTDSIPDLWAYTGGSNSSGVAVNDGKWHHYAIVGHGSTSDHWVDGVKVLSGTTNFGNSAFSKGVVAFDYTTDGVTPFGSNHWDGQLAHLAVFNRSLTDGEVEFHAAIGLTAPSTLSLPGAGDLLLGRAGISVVVDAGFPSAITPPALKGKAGIAVTIAATPLGSTGAITPPALKGKALVSVVVATMAPGAVVPGSVRGKAGIAVSFVPFTSVPTFITSGGVKYARLSGPSAWLISVNPSRLRGLYIASGSSQRVIATDTRSYGSGETFLDETIPVGPARELQFPLAQGLIVTTFGAGTVMVRFD